MPAFENKAVDEGLEGIRQKQAKTGKSSRMQGTPAGGGRRIVAIPKAT
jgi:hypothetical protein